MASAQLIRSFGLKANIFFSRATPAGSVPGNKPYRSIPSDSGKFFTSAIYFGVKKSSVFSSGVPRTLKIFPSWSVLSLLALAVGLLDLEAAGESG